MINKVKKITDICKEIITLKVWIINNPTKVSKIIEGDNFSKQNILTEKSIQVFFDALPKDKKYQLFDLYMENVYMIHTISGCCIMDNDVLWD